MKTLYKELDDVNFQNNLSFSLYAVPFVSYVVITSEDGTKSEEDKY